jgi:hypothetical protein
VQKTLSILAVFSVISVGVLGNFYQFSTNHPGSGNASASTQLENITEVEEVDQISKKEPLLDKQLRLLKFAYSAAKRAGLKSPEILQGIIYQESKAGALTSYRVAGQEAGLGTNKRYYGISQIKLSAAKDVVNKYPDLKKRHGFHTDTDEELIANLIMNDEFNIEVASLYLKIISDNYGSGKDYMIAAYNQGPGGAKRLQDPGSFGYVIKVKSHIKNMK